ncbi:MAG TPA: hypothetical protein VF777_05310 [Phycisphaerales bacterium]
MPKNRLLCWTSAAGFSTFAGSYKSFDCADPAMPLGCPADINLRP